MSTVITINLPYRVRAFLYVFTALGTPFVAYLLAKGFITDLESVLWSAEVSVVSMIAALNVADPNKE